MRATEDLVKYGSFHTGEVISTYNNLRFENRPWKQTNYDLANLMSSYLFIFARAEIRTLKDLPIVLRMVQNKT
jgi:hypothetical protein